jgi:hypothetical protein
MASRYRIEYYKQGKHVKSCYASEYPGIVERLYDADAIKIVDQRTTVHD